MINVHKSSGKMNFLTKLEVVINQRKWEQYTESQKDSGNNFSMEKL